MPRPRPGRSSTSSSPAGSPSTTASTSSPTPPTRSAASSSRSPRRTPGVRICEHLPELAQRSHRWALVRSLTHPSNDHSAGHLHHAHRPVGHCRRASTRASRKPTDWPSIAAVAGAVTPAAQQPAAGRRAAGPDRPQHRPRHPRPVRRHDGPAPRPVVHRGVAVRPEGLRRLSRVRVRPPGSGRASRKTTALPGAQPDAARGRRRTTASPTA